VTTNQQCLAPSVPPPTPLRAHYRVDSWSPGLSLGRLNAMEVETPFLVFDRSSVERRYAELTEVLPGLSVFFAAKCNSAGPLLDTLAGLGASFEVASAAELKLVTATGVPASAVLYSNPVKPPGHIVEAYASGLYRFAFDSEPEVHKLARYAPGASVYARLRVNDEGSLFPLSKKFGTSVDEAARLLELAHGLDLVPYGVTFHVGSQCTNPMAWDRALEDCAAVMRRLLRRGIRLLMVDLGGGLPARYTAPVPELATIASVIRTALTRLPYQPALLAAEPGRYLVAESGVLAASVIGVADRDGQRWAFLDVGGYNGLMEAVQTGGRWLFPLLTSRPDPFRESTVPTVVTGPSCDSSDTMFYDASLPAGLEVGDRVYIGSAGAYTNAYATAFNGFPVPTLHFVDGRPVAQRPVPVPALVTV
jgi:ornithine decarboxylase